jgi:NAD(P)-dependent dehydrogenase (short-subunit alcohol dehydrogenase family)
VKALHNKTALVLGAGSERGMGAAIASALRDAGARVVIAARNSERLQATAQALGVAGRSCDAGDEDSVSSLFDEVAANHGGLDIAVYAAGQNHFSPIAKFDPARAGQVVKTQLIGGLLFIKHAARAIGQDGSIILLSSLTARLPAAGTAVYAGTKAAMEHITKVAAVEYAPDNIRVNGIAPGLQRTDMTEAMFASHGVERASVRETPLGRLGQPGDIAAAALWLAQDDCFMTGVTLPVAGGAELRRIPTFEEMAD